MLVGAVVMAEVAWLVARAVGGNTGLAALARVAAAGAAGLVAYVVVLAVLRVPELDQLRRRLVRRNPSTT
jgi:hypothetical protein